LELDIRNIEIFDINGELNNEFIDVHEKNIRILGDRIALMTTKLDIVLEQLVSAEAESTQWMELEAELAQICHEIGQDYKHRALITTFYKRGLKLFEELKSRREAR
jgi:DNA repair photolyase